MAMQLERDAERVVGHLLIGGERVDGPQRLDVTNPAHPSEVVGSIVRGTPADVDRAVAAAKAAQPAWAARTFEERAAAIARGLEALKAGVDERAVLYVRENGKVLAEARGEIGALPAAFGLALEYAAELGAQRTVPSAAGRTLIDYRPYGVVASIVPWNSPVFLAFNQIVSGLLAGNAIVVKPPESSPLALMACIDVLATALPPGTVNVVTGLPGEIGDAITTHPDIGKIGFTGSIRAARQIGANAAQTIKSVTLELGGNDAAIVLDDVDLDETTMKRMVSMVFMMTGQICMDIKRIYVPEMLFDRFYAAFRAVADRMVVGDGLAPAVTTGPMHSRAQLERGLGFVDDARRRGAKVDLVGSIQDPEVFREGYFMQPSIVTNIEPTAPLVVEEQFCASIPIITYRDLDDAIAQANDSVFGLGGSVWGRDVDRALDVAKKVAAGTVWVNTHGIPYINRRAPYGGVKQSGIGRKSGLEGILDYMQSQTISTWEPR